MVSSQRRKEDSDFGIFLNQIVFTSCLTCVYIFEISPFLIIFINIGLILESLVDIPALPGRYDKSS